MIEVENAKRKNDITRFINLLPDADVAKLENFIISENFQIDDENGQSNINEDALIDILGDEDGLLTEDTKNKIKVIFEAAVTQKVTKNLQESIQSLTEKVEQFFTEAQDKADAYGEYVRTELEKEFEEKLATLNEQVDEYLDYVTQEWINDNKLAVEQGVKNMISENILNGLKALFTENYIEVPTQKMNLIADLEQKVASLLESNVKLNTQIREKNSQITELLKEQTLNTLTKDLTDLERDKLVNLAHGLQTDSMESFKDKVMILKESISQPKEKPAKVGTLLKEENLFAKETKETSVDPRIQGYLDILAKKR